MNVKIEVPSEKRSCNLCEKEFKFDEYNSLYENTCDGCAKKVYPLTYAVRQKVQEYHGIDAARDIFGPKHDGCIPDSLLGEDCALSIISLFKVIGHTIAEAAGLPEGEHTVIVEPSYDDSTWWLITKNKDGGIPYPIDSQVIFFNYWKAWHLGDQTNDKIEKLLHSWKDEIELSIRQIEANTKQAEQTKNLAELAKTIKTKTLAQKNARCQRKKGGS